MIDDELRSVKDNKTVRWDEADRKSAQICWKGIWKQKENDSVLVSEVRSKKRREAQVSSTFRSRGWNNYRISYLDLELKDIDRKKMR
jgi:ribosomal protein L2